MNSLYLTPHDRAEELLERALDLPAASKRCAQVVSAENRQINTPLQQPSIWPVTSPAKRTECRKVMGENGKTRGRENGHKTNALGLVFPFSRFPLFAQGGPNA